ncbi:hypothetical protein LTR64_000248 [Lithohypha guttulata]|uniref:uncharacterized protein n=1 Tax=Lithohypha guttulata TaxID=1690604 RepID=UPI002DDEEF14|nr:hypothetical protein LTR51_007610 [Lithohypha guttulata]
MKLNIQVLQPHQLLDPANKTLLHNINDLINDAYSIHGHPELDGSYHYQALYKERRITCEDQLVHELGESGSIAVCTDNDLNEVPEMVHRIEKANVYYPSKYGQVVAVASLKPWGGKKTVLFAKARQLAREGNGASSVNDIDLARLSQQELAQQEHKSGTWDWEVSACACVNYPRYRRQGLMVQSLDALLDKLTRRHNELKAAGDPRGSLQIKLWSSALVDSDNPQYWLRRGFVDEGEPDLAPAGLWSSVRDFEIQTLSKVLE